MALSVPAYVSMRENADAIVVLEGVLPNTLYVLAMLLGLASIVIAVMLRRRVRRNGVVKRPDLRRIAITLAWIAAVIWILPFCTMAGSGL